MPTYNYACNSCGHRFEIVQKISDPLLTDCPQCQKSTLKKVISAAGIVFKGSGWNRLGHSKDDSQNNPPPACGTGSCPSCSFN